MEKNRAVAVPAAPPLKLVGLPLPDGNAVGVMLTEWQSEALGEAVPCPAWPEGEGEGVPAPAVSVGVALALWEEEGALEAVVRADVDGGKEGDVEREGV